jgi:hypothetical protein
MKTNRAQIPTDVAAYLGWSEEKVRHCELLVAPDPSHDNVAALRLKTRFGVIDMLWSGSSESIEECEWTSFPPRSRS